MQGIGGGVFSAVGHYDYNLKANADFLSKYTNHLMYVRHQQATAWFTIISSLLIMVVISFHVSKSKYLFQVGQNGKETPWTLFSK